MMRIGSKVIVLIVIILALASACANGGADEARSEETNVEGPALVMFYTDN